MQNKKKNSTNSIEYDYLKASSAQDCTGLIPSGVKDDSEIENYEEIYSFLPKAIRPDDLSSGPES